MITPKKSGAIKHTLTSTELAALQQEAADIIRPWNGKDPMSLVAGCSLPKPGGYTVWFNIGTFFFKTKSGGRSERIKLAPDEIGVAFYYADRRSSYAVFSVPALWAATLNPQPVQLALF